MDLTTERNDFESQDVNPYNNSQRARANIFWVWNPTGGEKPTDASASSSKTAIPVEQLDSNFSMGTWASYQFDDQGFTSHQVND